MRLHREWRFFISHKAGTTQPVLLIDKHFRRNTVCRCIVSSTPLCPGTILWAQLRVLQFSPILTMTASSECRPFGLKAVPKIVTTLDTS